MKIAINKNIIPVFAAITASSILAGIILDYNLNIYWLWLVVLILSNNALIILVLNASTRKLLNNEKKEILLAIENFNFNSFKEPVINSKFREFDEVYKALNTLYEKLEKREQMREEVLKLVGTASANMELSDMLNDLMPKISEATESDWSAFYQANDITNKLELKYSLGFSKRLYSEYDLSIGEGFIGSAAASGKIRILKNMPDDTVYITRTVLGEIKPKNLMTVPIMNHDKLLGVLVLASVHEYSEYSKELIEFINYYLGLAIGNGITYERTKRLTNELQFQNKLIQNLNEDLESKIEERTVFLNSILNSIQDYAIYSIDKSGCIIAWNKCAENVFGYSEEEAMGQHIILIYTEDEIKNNELDKKMGFIRVNSRYSEKGWRIKKNRMRCFMEMTFYAMYDKNGEMIGATSISKDITATKIREAVENDSY